MLKCPYCFCDTGLACCDKHDAHYCKFCNVWLEKDCKSKTCNYCKDRPEKPSDVISQHNKQDISLCKSCYCMTKTIKGKCGKCKADKSQNQVQTNSHPEDKTVNRGRDAQAGDFQLHTDNVIPHDTLSKNHGHQESISETPNQKQNPDDVFSIKSEEKNNGSM